MTAEQLQYALDAKVPVEQAKGYLARALSVDVDTAREVLRRYARTVQRRLSDVSVDVADGSLRPEDLVAVATDGRRAGSGGLTPPSPRSGRASSDAGCAAAGALRRR